MKGHAQREAWMTKQTEHTSGTTKAAAPSTGAVPGSELRNGLAHRPPGRQLPQAEGLAEWHSAQGGQTGFSGKLLLTKDFPGNQGLLPGQGWERTLGKQRRRLLAEYVIS